jgi:hypothetical protein
VVGHDEKRAKGKASKKKAKSKLAPFDEPNPKGMRHPLSLYKGCPPAKPAMEHYRGKLFVVEVDHIRIRE